MGNAKCTNCGADLPAIDGSPCPKCGRIADEGRITNSFQTVRKVTAKAGYKAATKRHILGMVSLYRSYPNFKRFNIIVAIIIGVILTGMSLLINTVFPNLSGIFVNFATNILGVFLGIFVVLKFTPKILVGAEWYDWVKMTKS
jgi:hypothetical protein